MIKKLLLLTIFISFSYAHKLSVFTDFEDNKLYVSAYFANGNACQNCKLKIIKDDELLVEDKTNEKGEFETTINAKEFLLSVDAGGGHAVLKSIHEVVKPQTRYENKQLQKLEDENKKLKVQVKILEEKLEQMDIFKTIFALLVIVGIFAFLKRIKK